MNKKGQSLVIFIVLLPAFLLLAAFIIDTGIMLNSHIKGESLLKSAIEDNKDIKEYFKINDIEILSNKSIITDTKKCDIIEYRIDSVFGNVIGKKYYDIKVKYCRG